jgi:hypothetical protein
LLDHRLKFVVDNKRLVDSFVFGKSLDYVVRNFESLGKLHSAFAGKSDVFATYRTSAAEKISTLSANCQNFDLFPGIGVDESLCRFD